MKAGDICDFIINIAKGTLQFKINGTLIDLSIKDEALKLEMVDLYMTVMMQIQGPAICFQNPSKTDQINITLK